MSDIILEVQKREVKKSLMKKIREEGFIPAIIYGHGKENLPIQLSKRDFVKEMHGHFESNIFIDLKIDGENQPSKTVFIKSLQRECVSRDIEHVDFVEINADEKININVPVHLKGEAIGVTKGGGHLEFSLRHIEVNCLPKDTPKEIELDITDLGVGQSIHAGDLKLGDAVKIITTHEASIVSILEVEAEPAAEVEAEAEKSE